jgi:hypothetical protein
LISTEMIGEPFARIELWAAELSKLKNNSR